MKSTWNNRSKFKIIILFLLFATLGIFIMPLLNIKLNPEKGNKNIFINYYMPGVLPGNIENTVTSRLEGIVASLKGVEEIQSESKLGEGNILIKLDKYTDIDKFRIKLSSSIRQTWHNFPDGVTYPNVNYGFNKKKAELAVMVYRMQVGENIQEFNKSVTDILIPELHKINGLKEARIDGLYDEEIHLLVDNNKMKQQNISIDEILKSLRDYSKNITLNKVELVNHGERELYDIKIQQIENASLNLEKIIVKNNSNHFITINHLVSIQKKQKKINSRFRVNGKNNIYLRLFAEENQNHLKLTKEIKSQLNNDKIASIPGISLSLVSDSTYFVKSELKKITYRTLLTLFLLMLCVWLIYRDKNYLLLITISLVINILISLFIFYMLGIEIHFYTLAGITISLGMIIDNSIIIIDYIKKFLENRIILPMFAATITTIGTLYAVLIFPFQKDFFWNDFTLVIIINLGLSFITSLFFIPALINKFPLKRTSQHSYKTQLKIIKFNKIYSTYINWAIKHKKLIITIFIWGFGIPFFKLPNKINEDNRAAKLYNSLFSNQDFIENVRPWVDKITGGALRPFVIDIIDNYKSNIPHEKKLNITAQLHKEYAFKHLNIQLQAVENLLLKYKGVQSVQTELDRNKHANINISFYENVKEYLPYELLDFLAEYLKKYAGGADWSLTYDDTNIQVKHEIQRNKIWGFYLYGYNFDELMDYAKQTKKEILKNPRVRNVTINSKYSLFSRNDFQTQSSFHFYDTLYTQNILLKKNIIETISGINKVPVPLGEYNFNKKLIHYYLDIKEKENSLYALINKNKKFGDKTLKLASVGEIRKEKMPMEIVRYNQQYQVFLNFDFMGTGAMARKFENEQIKLFNNTSSPGYSAGYKFKDLNNNHFNWLLLILIIVLIVFFITSILFESVKQAFWVILIIPFSYIGVFLSFWIFNISFDQGGYAAFILLGGITVNASIYLTNSFNNIKNSMDNHAKFIKAWNRMITPIVITIFSTILGFTPFLIGKSEVFWKALATGTIGGLLFSLFVLTSILPIALIRKTN